MTGFLLTLLVIGVISIISIILAYSGIKDSWKEHSSGADFILEFEKFKNLYHVSPEKYTVRPNTTQYHINYRCTKIGFSYSDYKKYLKWLKHTRAENKKLQSLRAKSEFLTSVKDDLEQYKKAAKKEFDQKMDEIRNSTTSTLTGLTEEDEEVIRQFLYEGVKYELDA